MPEHPEPLLIGESALLAAAPGPPAGVTLREVTGQADLERIGDLEQEVWGDDHDRLPAGARA